MRARFERGSNSTRLSKPKTESLEQKVQETETQNQTLLAKVDSLTEDLKKRTDSQVDKDQVQKLVKERMHLERVAMAVVPKETKLDAMTNLDVMKTVIKTRSDKADLEGKSEAYIQARFDHIAESIDESLIEAANFGLAVWIRSRMQPRRQRHERK